MKASTLVRRLFHGSIVSAVIAALMLGGGLLPANATIADKDNDYNNDRASDVLAVDASEGCLFRWNGNGSGSINPAAPVGCGWGNYVNQLAAPGDINSDGDADIVGINASNGCLFRWLGTGAGTFGAGTQLGCGWSGYQDNLTGAGDLNGDGNGDLEGVNSSGCLFRWLSNGAGVFNTGVQLGCGWSNYRFTLAAPGDLNGDGDADIVAINASTGCLFRWLGDGTGGVGAGTQLGCGWSAYETALSGMGDLNGDGDGDLVGINTSTNCLFRWLGDGAGGFGTGVQLGCGWGDKYLAR